MVLRCRRIYGEVRSFASMTTLEERENACAAFLEPQGKPMSRRSIVMHNARIIRRQVKGMAKDRRRLVFAQMRSGQMAVLLSALEQSSAASRPK